MALTSKSIDEILTLIADAYDALVAPKRIFRNNNNKLWLVFRAIGAGYSIIQDAALALRSRFDPATCTEEDLYSTAKLVGTAFKQGSGSLLRITITNTDSVNSKTLTAGAYNYISVSGEVFSFELILDLTLAPLATSMITAISQNKGAFPVSDIADITVTRSDFVAIDPAFGFSCAANSGSLGYLDESAWDFRQRILTDTSRQDAIKELELAIRNLANVFECDIVFNATASDATYDGITLTPFQMLIIITGYPSTAIAETVVAHTIYHTKMVNPAYVVNYVDSHYVGGSYPVYFMYHLQKDFTVSVSYRYDSTKIIQANAEAKMDAALNKYRNSSQHVDILTENDIYTLLQDLNLTSVKILNVDLLVSGSPVAYVEVPKTRMLNMTAVTMSGSDVSV